MTFSYWVSYRLLLHLEYFGRGPIVHPVTRLVSNEHQRDISGFVLENLERRETMCESFQGDDKYRSAFIERMDRDSSSESTIVVRATESIDANGDSSKQGGDAIGEMGYRNAEIAFGTALERMNFHIQES